MFLSSGSVLSENGFNNSIDVNSSDISEDELDSGGLFGTGISFSRFASFVGFGVGLPDDTPSWFTLLFAIWQSLITVFSIGFVISSIWDG
jgi:hypothetical protein